jgi:hypothetical protein
MIPGWPYSVIAALEPGRTCWTAVLDAVRLGADDDETAVTAAQVREVIARLVPAGHWRTAIRPAPQVTTSMLTSRYGMAVTAAWDRVYPRLTHPAPGWITTGRCRSSREPRSGCRSTGCPATVTPSRSGCGSRPPAPPPDQVDRCWQAYLRRFDLEHTFRLFKQVLGWTAPKICDPAAADRWTWLIIACHAQLRLARPLADDLRRPWERPAQPGRLTPARVRRGFRNIRAKTAKPASAPNPGKPGPGRSLGSKNRRPAPSYEVGKTFKRERSLKAMREQGVKRQA